MLRYTLYTFWYRLIIKKLSDNENITMLNIDKVREVVVMKKTKYFEKFFLLVNTIYSVKLNKNSTKKNEKKCNECYKNLSQFYPLISLNSSEIISNICRHFYPSNLYVTVKIYKVFPNESIVDVTIQSIISYTGTGPKVLRSILTKVFPILAGTIYTA